MARRRVRRTGAGRCDSSRWGTTCRRSSSCLTLALTTLTFTPNPNPHHTPHSTPNHDVQAEQQLLRLWRQHGAQPGALAPLGAPLLELARRRLGALVCHSSSATHYTPLASAASATPLSLSHTP